MEVLNRLRRSRKFWLAMAAIVQTIVFAAWPNFPDAVWQHVDAILLILISTIAAEDAAASLGGRGA